MKDKYSLQNKNIRQLLAIIVKKYIIEPSTLFVVGLDKQTTSIILQIVDARLSYKKDIITTTPTGESFQASSQQALSGAQ
jgi:hypothetical protein